METERSDGAGINRERTARFDAYRATLSVEEQAELDCLLEEVIETMHLRGCRSFGVLMGKELIVALVDYKQMIYQRKGGNPK